MDKELIKFRLSQDLKQMSRKDFNEKILLEIEIPKKKKTVVFDEKPVFNIFLLTSFIAIIINNGLVTELKEIDYLIISVIFCLPICFLIFNIIYKLSFLNYR